MTRRKEADHELIEVPISELRGHQASEIISMDISPERVENLTQGYFVGDKAIGRRKDVRQMLEDKVVGAIGKKGKYLTDKLFELIEGVHVVDRFGPNQEILKVYKQKPDLNALIYAMDRVLGKPKQLSVQASFSLSDLLKRTHKINGRQNNNTIRSPGRGDNDEVSE